MKEFESLDQIYRWAVLGSPTCVECGEPVTKMCVESHPGGIKLQKIGFPVWIWFECAHCGYQSALWKVVKRERKKSRYERKTGE